MKNLSLILLFTLSFAAVAKAQEVPVVKYDKLEALIKESGEKVKVINFWATWCGPCVKELPLFQTLSSQGNVDVHLVSLDYADAIDKVNKFVDRKGYGEMDIMLLDEIDYNSWIDRVDKSWSGAIPATLIINPETGKRVFVEGELKKEQLEKHIKELSN
ncbi:TlpA family protein disulfide reductase [Fulvivirga ligni]|uniref:TlpA family protein disulfide reductase n=1 Tax=Fulvivirga ligni TaxID=2904246 RepID=UPI001F2C71E5|nr:TlpA disulfide reductase family protein [Fulvivirga ligni]UII22174.1 TlpA family protein disulfide reductase [Fulvivirga ligni]